MFFRKPPKKEEVSTSELYNYIDTCFDSKLKRLSSKLPEIENGLKNSVSGFRDSVKKFSESGTVPNMEYLYGIKENSIMAQRPNYSSALLNLRTDWQPQVDSTIYEKGKGMLKFYSELANKVLTANNKFKLVIIGYAKELGNVKKHFENIERLCKELDSELGYCSQQLGEYKTIREKVNSMLEYMSGMDTLKELLNEVPGSGKLSDTNEEEITAEIKEKNSQLETSKIQYNQGNSNLATLLYPVERVARKHDYISHSKRKLTSYINKPLESITTDEDVIAINNHISEIIDEVNTGKITVKNPDSLVAQFTKIKNSGLLAMIKSVNASHAEMIAVEKEIGKLQIRLKQIRKDKDEETEMLEEKGKAKDKINDYRATIASKKSEIEKLLSEYYNRHVEIKLP